MKRVFAIILALAMVLSLGMTAFAAEETGSITVTNATYGKLYSIYKIFDADIRFAKDAEGNDTTEIVGITYTIDPETNQFFDELFGADGTTPNKFFSYNANSDEVVKNNGVNDSELVAYLTELLASGSFDTAQKSILTVEAGKTPDNYTLDFTYDETQHTTQVGPRIVFDDLPYGYYMVTSTLGTSVTINSNTPDVEVIDKNQEPAPDFDKQVQIGVDENGEPIWADANSAGMGDTVAYRISFTATNYEGAKQIRYYQVHDEKGDAIWAEFSSFRVTVNGKPLPRGYYLPAGGVNTGNWELLGDLTNEDDGWMTLPEAQRDINHAQWYLVHLGYDQYRITIPWLEGHTITTATGADGVPTYTVNFPEEPVSKYTSPSEVEIIYHAAIEANASVGATSHGNRFNKASASWISKNETGNTPPDEVVTRVYAIGLLKDDSDTGENLDGAKFELFKKNPTSDEYDVPVYVIPTGIDGVYALDSKGTDIERYTGTGKTTSREYYTILRDMSGTPMLDSNNAQIPNQALIELGDNQTNEVVTPENGKVIILGLEEGTYHMIETQPPTGYNGLTTPVVFEVNGTTAAPFAIFVDGNGDVADIQAANATFKERSYDVTSKTVHNSKGATLPSTGGEGKVMLITIGTMVAMAFAVLMITQKKMSIYKD